MAEAKTALVTKTVTTEVEVVNLELTREEASALRQVLGSVGGPPSTTRRGLIDSIMWALNDIGVKSRDLDDPTFDVAGSITFLTKESQGTYNEVSRKFGHGPYINQ